MQYRIFALAVPFALVLACSSSDTPDEPIEKSTAAAHSEVSLPGSNFEMDTDANLKVDDAAPSIDWANVDEVRKEDSPSGPNDESFGQGSKEDTPEPVVVDGSIPPNKSDLKQFGVYQEGDTSSGFLNLFWTRVQDPSGTTNMDFEFNKLQCTPNQTPADADCSANGLTPLRSIGDLLITYDLSKGGTVPILSLRQWTGTEWGPPVDLTASNKATGSINDSAIPAGDSDGLGALDPRTFGEAQIDLSAIFDPNKCESFGSAYLKSRSSDSFTAAMKDFVPPVPVNITNCGRVVVKKTNEGGAPLAGASFIISPPNVATPPVSSLPEVASGIFCIDSLLIGTQYTVHEQSAPPGYDPDPIDKSFTPTQSGTCSGVSGSTTPDLVFVNVAQKGAILVTKTRKHAADGPGNHPHQGVSFTVNGQTKATGADGTVCFDGLSFGSYAVHEVTPTGYHGEADKDVVVDNKASCSDTVYAGETVAFHNTPLSDITVSFASQVTGGTKAKITCTGLTPQGGDATPDAYDDVSELYSDLEPGTYACEIVVDP